ncbi:MAG: hypothetical protein ABJC07_11240 [Acidobacteriota bacterium]
MRHALRASALLVTLALGIGTLAAAPAGDKMQTASGNVAKLQATDRAVVVALSDGPETRFVWTNETKINGTLAVGARVTVRYTTLPDGQNLAHQISVARS